MTHENTYRDDKIHGYSYNNLLKIVVRIDTALNLTKFKTRGLQCLNNTFAFSITSIDNCHFKLDKLEFMRLQCGPYLLRHALTCLQTTLLNI
jgi:hypothetical protein